MHYTANFNTMPARLERNNMKKIAPSEMVKKLIERGYSEYSANIITAQFNEHPEDRRYWGTEEQTRRDIEEIIKSLPN